MCIAPDLVLLLRCIPDCTVVICVALRSVVRLKSFHVQMRARRVLILCLRIDRTVTRGQRRVLRLFRENIVSALCGE